MGQNRVLVVGAGGHARVCLDALACDDSLTIVGCVSADGAGIDNLGTPILGVDTDTSLVEKHGLTHAFVAVGDNMARERATSRVLQWGLGLVVARCASATVSPSVTLEAGTLLAPGSVVNAATHVGEGAIVNTSASIDHDCQVGSFAHVAPAVSLAGGVTVGRRAFVGMGARVLPGVRIGDDAVVGAGAVVITDVPAGATVVGMPARIVPRR